MNRWIHISAACLVLLALIIGCTSQETAPETSQAPANAESNDTVQATDVNGGDQDQQGHADRNHKVSYPTGSKPIAEVDFEDNAFPPTVSDSKWHQNAWQKNDCLRCHETGVGDAPEVAHLGMSSLLLEAKCRTCHVLIPGEKPHESAKARALGKVEEDVGYADFAFPPSIPVSGSHTSAWLKDDCMLCHETGLSGAPKVVHKRVPLIALQGKCRTCHVQPRVLDAGK